MTAIMEAHEQSSKNENHAPMDRRAFGGEVSSYGFKHRLCECCHVSADSTARAAIVN